MNRHIASLALAASLCMFWPAPDAWGQIGGAFSPPLGAMDTLNSAPVGPGGVGNIALDRARGVAGVPGPPMPGAPAAPGAMPGGMPGPPGAPTPTPQSSGYSYGYGPSYNYGYGGYGGGGYGGGGYGGGGQPATPTPTPIPTVKVLAGERVTDAVTGALLTDYYYLDIQDTLLDGNYFDDGTHGDEQAGDGMYSNVKQRADVMGPETHKYMARLLVALERSEELSPLDFFRMHVLTTETISEVGKLREAESERDKKLLYWAKTFMQEYRQDREDPSSPFWPLYIPPPPQPPSIAALRPVDGWLPPTSPRILADMEAAQAQANYSAYAGSGGYGGGGGGGY